MTYPPQGGQPDPYGQQNPPYGQQGPPGQYGQQPPGQYGQYGQQPQTGPQPQMGPPQAGPQPPYGQTAQFGDPYGQQQPYGQPGFQGGEPPKSKRGMVIAIIVIAVLVLGGGGVAVWQLTKGDDNPNASDNTSQTTEPPSDAPPTSEDSPSDEPPSETGSPSGDTSAVQTVAQEYADAVNSSNEAAATALMCNKSGGPGVLYTELAGQVPVEPGEIEMVSDDTATVKYTAQGDAGGPAAPLFFENQDGAWCVTV
jgi:hypothetical protein